MDRRHRTRAATIALFVVASLTTLPSPGDAAFPGKDGALAYMCTSQQSNVTEICVGNEDGSNQRQLTTGQSFGNDRPAWSADGAKIAFERRQSSQCCATDIYMMQANGNGLTALTNTPTITESGPAWSPDGTKIVYSRDDGQTVQLHILTVSTLSSQPLAGTVDGTYPSWSPDGKNIAFSSYKDGHQFCVEGGSCHAVAEIYVVPATGGAAENLTEHDQAHDLFPNWGPNSDKIVFERRSDPSVTTGRVLVMEAGGEHDFEPVGDGNDPAYEPAGNLVAFDFNGVIYTGAPTANVENADPTPLNGLHPDWQPCPGAACPSTAASAQSPSTTTVSAARVKKKIKATGSLEPAHPRGSMTVTLLKKKSGVFSAVKTVTATLTSDSKFAASFKRPGKGQCQVKARFNGDDDHLASEATKTLKC